MYIGDNGWLSMSKLRPIGGGPYLNMTIYTEICRREFIARKRTARQLFFVFTHHFCTKWVLNWKIKISVIISIQIFNTAYWPLISSL